MNKIIKFHEKAAHANKVAANLPSEAEAKEAVRTLLRWIGEDPSREGLKETPSRVLKAYRELFAGYQQDPAPILAKTFKEINNYDDIIIVKNIKVESHCEHHMLPFFGTAFVAYLPNERIVGISKLARIVELYARRLQTQEVLTRQIAEAIEEYLNPLGVAVGLNCKHLCMEYRGIKKCEAQTSTVTFTGEFKTNDQLQERLFRLLRGFDG